MSQFKVIEYPQTDLNESKDHPLLVSMLRFQGTKIGTFGVGIVCKIGYVWQARPGEATRGEYGAYMGMSLPDAREDDAVQQIARNGIKITKQEGEAIFLEELQRLYPHVQWHWRD